MSADALPWLRRSQQALLQAWNAGRMPQSVLVLAAPGLGAERLATWMAALVLCDGAAQRPCGTCPSCALLAAGTHPDLHVVRLDEDAKQIKVDQIRELISQLALKSYRRGYKVGIVEDAETLNANGANAFLKTLEEPFADTLLVMVARPSHRLPATIASRCSRVALRAPPPEEAIDWLRRQPGNPPEQEWLPALTLAGGAPLKALELGGAIAALDREMLEGLRAIAAGTVDVTLLADHWAKSDLGMRLAWLETWITRRVHRYLAGSASAQSAERVRLPAALLKPKIRALFKLLDGARDLRRWASTGMNQHLALEVLLLEGRSALTS